MGKKKIEAIKATAGTAQSIIIQRASRLAIYLEIKGTAPLIQNNFSQKALEQMLRKHMGISVERDKKKPRELVEQAKILNEAGKPCLKPNAIKKAILSASTTIKGMQKNLSAPILAQGDGGHSRTE